MSIIGTRAFLLSSFLLASGIPLLVFWAWPHTAALDQKLEEVQERHLLFATGASKTLETYHQNLLRTFNAVSNQLAMGQDISFARDWLGELQFRHLCLIDAETGEIRASYILDNPGMPDRIPAPMLERLRALAASSADPLAQIYKIHPDRAPGFLIARSVGEDIVFAEINPDFIRNVARGISFGEQGHAAVVDSIGNLISHPDAALQDTARNLSDLEPVRRLMSGETGVSTFYSPAIHTEVVAGFAHIDGPGWGVMVPQPIDELRNQARLLTESGLLVFAAGMAFAALLALLASGHAARLLDRFSRAANRMASGEEHVRIDPPRHVALREFEDLRQSFNDMAQQVEDARARLTRQARHDALTGLPNKREFLARCKKIMAETGADGTEHMIFYVDVDRFKSINDIYGHAVGDEVLRAIGRRLERTVRDRDIVARQSGDEFLLFHSAAQDEPESFLQDLQACLSRPVVVSGYQIPLTCSIGAAGLPSRPTNLETFLERADKAMYRAKRQGDGGLHVFGSDMQAELELEEALLRELKRDVLDGRIDVAFQPIHDRSTGEIFGFETLARWNTRDGTPIAPDRFIGLAEEGGVITQLGALVRQKAFLFAGRLGRIGAPLPVAVNVSRAELAARDFIAELTHSLRAASLPPGLVIVEVTESVFEDRSGQVATTLDRLKDLGIELWLDDFGKGFSSHGLLMNYHFDALKIDATFTGDFETDARSNAIIASLVDLANRLNLPVTLEGLETDRQVTIADQMSIDRYQGFVFHKPLSETEALALVQSFEHRLESSAAQ